MNEKLKAALGHIASRASKDSAFLGHSLRLYQEANGLGDQALAKFLECDVDTLPRISLCRHPAMAGPRAAGAVRRIADFVPCNATQLLRLLRETAALGALKIVTKKASAPAVLLAARDRLPDRDGRNRTRSRGSKKGKR